MLTRPPRSRREAKRVHDGLCREHKTVALLSSGGHQPHKQERHAHE